MSECSCNNLSFYAMAARRTILSNVKKKMMSSFEENTRFFYAMFLLYCLSFFIVLPWVCSDKAHSKYMSSSWKNEQLHKIVMDKNKELLDAANRYIARLDFASTLASYDKLLSNQSIDIVVIVLTVKRAYGKEDVGYLPQLMARFDRLFSKDTLFSNKALFMCNTYPGPGKHKEAERLAEYFPMFARFPLEDPSSVIMEMFEKEKQDYAYCLGLATKYKPKYVLMVQDDALPLNNMFHVLRYALDNNVERRWHSGELELNSKQWGYFKLYYPEKWQGYASEYSHLLELAALGGISGTIAMIVLYLCSSRKKLISQYKSRTEVFVFILGAMYGILFAILVGRQYLQELRRLSYLLYNVVDAPDCCSPSVLYPGHLVPDITLHLNNTKSTSNFAVDISIDDYITKKGYQKFLIEPNLFKHIGYISTIKGPSKNPALYLY